MAYVSQPLSPLGEDIADISERPPQRISPNFLTMNKQFNCLPTLGLNGSNSLKMLPLNVFSKFKGIHPNDINLVGKNQNSLLLKENAASKETAEQREPKTSEKKISNENVAKKNYYQKKKATQLKPYNIIKTHQNIEILEGRINEGTDLDHFHPAMAVNLYNNRKVKNLAKDEDYRFHNYAPKLPKQRIPDFWCPRFYDNDEDKLSKIRSEKVKTRIEVFYTKRGLDILVEDIRFSPTYLSLPHIRLETDDDDDMTDLDYF